MGDELVLPPLIPVDDYNPIESKLAVSVQWLIMRVFGRYEDIPDRLKNGVARDEHANVSMDASVIAAMTNGSLYSQAAAKIFKEPHLVTQSHASVLAALTDYGIDVLQRPEEGGEKVTEEELSSPDNFMPLAHLAMIDGLMMAHLRNVVSVERVVDAVSRHTSVEDRERPMDPVDALLFWINKICLLVRDEVERAQIQLKCTDADGGTIPEMEDLYDELSDGQCLCTVVAFYRQHEMNIQDIFFNFGRDFTNPECQYNITLLREFCHNALPRNPFHFEVEDLVYLHDCMQMNVNVFLAELFDLFEPEPIVPLQPEIPQSPRRFVPIQAVPIPALRAANQAARSPHPPRVRHPFHNVQVSQSPGRSMSVMSQDSLFSNRTNISQRTPEQQWGGNVTNFGQLNQADSGSSGNVSQMSGHYTRSDSLPAASVRLQLEEKRREHERRKQMQSTVNESERLEKGKAAFFAVMNQARQAPPPPVSDSPNSKLIELMNQKLESLESKFAELRGEPQPPHHQFGMGGRALSQPSVYQMDLPSGPASARPEYGTLPHGMSQAGYSQQQQQPYDFYGQQQGQSHYAQPQIPMRSSLSNGMINYLPGQVPPQYDYQQQMAAQQQGQMRGAPPPSYGSPAQLDGYSGYGQQPPPGMGQYPQQQQQGFSLMHQSAHAANGFPMHPQQQQQMQQPLGNMAYGQPAAYAPPPQMGADMPPYNTSPQPQPYHSQSGAMPIQTAPGGGAYSYAGTPENRPPNEFDAPASGGGTFRLHNSDASSSRLDPPLELNRNLTNWGMTYKAGAERPRPRRTWENQTFIKHEMDLVNHPDLVPVVPDSSELPAQAQRRSPAPSSVGTLPRKSRDGSVGPEAPEKQQVTDPGPATSHSSPPRDPESTNGHGQNGTDTPTTARSTAPVQGPAFVVTDDQAAEDFDKIAEQRREAKKAALLAKTMRRKEESENKIDQIEQRNQERRRAEEAKREAADQRKMEKEVQRQKILEEYKRKKMEKEMGLEPSSARGPPGRGHSQPPFIRTKSQMSESAMTSEKSRAPRSRGASTVERTSVSSLAEPTHKLFAKAVSKSNRSQIVNALQYSILPGAVNDTLRTKVTGDLATSTAKHFLVLFRDHKCQYRGLYAWDQQSDTCEKLSGQGPAKCTEAMMNLYFKYDCGSKSFSQIPVKHLGATTDGFSIHDTFWQKPRIPHSGGAAHRNN